jgi:hypothetical protein
MSNAVTPVPVTPLTSQAAISPIKIAYALAEGKSASGTAANKVRIPNALTREVMAETEAGVNIVNCANLDDLFNQLDS